MTPAEALPLLQDELHFEPRTAQAYINAQGYCEYCGADLIVNRLGYACANIDHLLPRAKFPPEIYEMGENYVLACSLCNGVKRDHSVLLGGEDPASMLLNHRGTLISRAKENIKEKLIVPNKLWESANLIFASIRNPRILAEP